MTRSTLAGQCGPSRDARRDTAIPAREICVLLQQPDRAGRPGLVPDHRTLDLGEEARLHKLRAWDLAATEHGCDYTKSALMGKDTATGACIIFNINRKQLSPHQVGNLVR